MAYVSLSQSFGAAKANLPCTITEVSTGLPAVILSSATGGLLSSNGDHYLDSSGNLSVFVEGGRTWQVNVDSGVAPGPVGLLNSAQVAAGAVGVAGVTAAGMITDVNGDAVSVSSLTPAQEAAGATGVAGITAEGVLKKTDGTTISVGGGAWGGITGTLSSQTDLSSALSLKANDYTPVDISTNTTLTAASHANRLIRITEGASPTLTFQTDALGGFSRGDILVVQNLGAGTAFLQAGAGATVVGGDASSSAVVGPTSTGTFSCGYAVNTLRQIGGMLDGYFYVGPWANRTVGTSGGHLAWITDIGGGTQWRWDPTVSAWRPSSIIELRAVNTSALPAPLVTGVQTVAGWVITLPAGVCVAGTRFDAWATWSKSGATDALGTVTIRVNSSAAAAGTQLNSNAGVAATRVAGLIPVGVRFTSATAWTVESQFQGTSTSAPATGAITAGAAVFLVPIINQAATTDTVSLEQHAVRLYPAGQ